MILEIFVILLCCIIIGVVLALIFLSYMWLLNQAGEWMTQKFGLWPSTVIMGTIVITIPVFLLALMAYLSYKL